MNSTLNAFFPNTQILYITIAIVASLLAFIAEFFKKQHKLFSNVLILISYFILAFFATFSGVGSDKEHYAYFFSVINKESTYSGLEPLFNLIIICFKKNYKRSKSIFDDNCFFDNYFYLRRYFDKQSNNSHRLFCVNICLPLLFPIIQSYAFIFRYEHFATFQFFTFKKEILFLSYCFDYLLLYSLFLHFHDYYHVSYHDSRKA